LFRRFPSPASNRCNIGGGLAVVYVFAWFFVILLLGLWTLSAWGIHTLALWTLSQAGGVSLDGTVFGGLRLPEVVLAWLPPQAVEAANALLASLGPLFGSLLQAMPSLAGVLTLAGWAIWGLGCALLLAVGAGLHLVLALWRRRRGGGAAPPDPGHVSSKLPVAASARP
jgi:hypothetical protein